MKLCDELRANNIQIDNHYSDLYVIDSPKTREILEKHGKKIDGWNVQPFINQIDGKRWLDVPFNWSE